MRMFCCVFLFFFLCAGGYARKNTPAGQIFWTKPCLQSLTGNGITVSWLTHVPVYSWVEYGTDTLELKKARTMLDGQVVCNNYIHKIRLENLEAGETYYYRVCSREILKYGAYSKIFGHTAVSPFYSFRVPGERETDFTALIFNDIHQEFPTMAALCKQIEEVDYDFVIFNGDMLDAPGCEEEVVEAFSFYQGQVRAEEKPVFYLRGNHEIRNAYSLHLRRLLYYMGDKTYGAFNWGDTRFVLLDCGEDKTDDHWVYYGLNDFSGFRDEQTEFLRRELHSKATEIVQSVIHPMAFESLSAGREKSVGASYSALGKRDRLHALPGIMGRFAEKKSCRCIVECTYPRLCLPSGRQSG